MLPNSTNLLPEDAQKLLRRQYFIRVGVVALTLLSVVVVLSGAMLYPTHVFLENQISVKQEQFKDLSNNAASADEAAFEARLRALSAQTERIKQLSAVTAASSMLMSVLSVEHTGIVLSGFTITPGSKNPGTAILLGRAGTRDNLRAYQLALQSAPFATSANLPVSAYAKDSDIDFTITVLFKKP